MDANLTSLLGGGAIIATITMAWGYIRGVFSSIKDFFIVKSNIDNDLYKAMLFYCTRHYKKYPFQIPAYSSDNFKIKSTKRLGLVAMNDPIYLLKNNLTFFSGIKPITFYHEVTQSGPDVSTVSFIRGLFNIEKLIIDAVEEYNEFRSDTKNTNRVRFQIKYFTGTGMRAFGGGNDGAMLATPASDKEPASTTGNNIQNYLARGCRILKWKVDDIDDDIDNQKINYLALPKEIEWFLTEIEQWKNSETWYKEKKIPWKRGTLIYGKPGTGKSALVSSVAQMHDLPICVFDLSTMSNEDFKRSWTSALTYAPCVVLIEDIDNIFNGRDNITKKDFKDSLTFDCFLNTISGVSNSDGILLMVTTNDISKMDEALGVPRTDKHVNGTFISTRPGRIDRVLEMKVLDADCRKRLASRILKEAPEYIERVVEDGEGDTGAQFQERCSQIALSEFWKKGGKL